MTPSQLIRQWCAAQGYAYKYGNPAHIEVWMGETDFSASTDGVCVFAHLLTASDYDPSGRDRHNLAVYFATLTPFDFDTDTIDQVTEGLHARAKSMLAYIQQGNAFGWEGARFQYGYDDYAENVAWCCLRVTLTALASDCVPIPHEEPQYEMVEGLPEAALESMGVQGITICPLAAMMSTYPLLAILWVSSVEMESPRVLVNGLEIQKEPIHSIIDDRNIELAPMLEPYRGWYLYAAEYNADNVIAAGEYVQFDVYDGHQVLACGGIMPQAEEESK